MTADLVTAGEHGDGLRQAEISSCHVGALGTGVRFSVDDPIEHFGANRGVELNGAKNNPLAPAGSV